MDEVTCVSSMDEYGVVFSTCELASTGVGRIPWELLIYAGMLIGAGLALRFARRPL